MADTNKRPIQDTDRKVVINVLEELLNSIRTTCAEKANVSLLGRIQGKHPGLKALTAWAWETLHTSLVLLTLKTNNLFEITFNSTEGQTHALTQTDLSCEATTITFSSWRPHFNAKTQQEHEQLDHPIWLQVVDLCQFLRKDSFLRYTSREPLCLFMDYKPVGDSPAEHSLWLWGNTWLEKLESVPKDWN